MTISYVSGPSGALEQIAISSQIFFSRSQVAKPYPLILFLRLFQQLQYNAKMLRECYNFMIAYAIISFILSLRLQSFAYGTHISTFNDYKCQESFQDLDGPNG
jgi:hypothetical protein